MQSPPEGVEAVRMKTAMVAVQANGGQHEKVLTIRELLCLTRAEILEIRRILVAQLGELPQDSIERQEAIETITNIDILMASPVLHQRCTPLIFRL